MSQTNDLISSVVVYLQSSAVFGTSTDFTIYTPSDWFSKPALEAPYVYIAPGQIFSTLNASHLEKHITITAQVFAEFLPSVTDDGTKTDLEALYYYVEQLLDELSSVSTGGTYYMQEITVMEFPIQPEDRQDLLGGTIQMTFGGQYYFGG